MVDCSGDIKTLVGAIKFVFTLIQWAIPLVLIVLGTVDMFKAMSSGDEKKTKEAKDTFIRRLIYAVVAFLIPFIISLVFTFTSDAIADDAAKNGKTVYGNFMTCWGSNDSGDNNDENKNCYAVYSNGHETPLTNPKEKCFGETNDGAKLMWK